MPVDRELQRCHLPANLSAQPECYVPALFNWELLSRMARSEGIEDLGLRVALERNHDLMTTALVQRALSAPTLLRAIQIFKGLCNRESSGMRVSLSRQADGQRFCLAKTFEPGTPGYRQTEWLAAEIAGTSTRSLQRRLAEVGYDYSTLVTEVRFGVATQLLTQTDAPAIDIANATGYRDPSQFSRAFRRLAGSTPREYRHRRA